jgi:hypothetical protein
LLDGQLLFSVVQGGDLLPLSKVERYLRRHVASEAQDRLRFFPVQNTASEAWAILDLLLPQIATLSADEATFVAHAKGTSPQRAECIPVWIWADLLYAHDLPPRPVLESVLQKYACAGSFRSHAKPPGQQCAWHYSGTFFWFNHARVFNREWLPRVHNRYVLEAWLGSFVPESESHCFFGAERQAFYTRERLLPLLGAEGYQQASQAMLREIPRCREALRTF